MSRQAIGVLILAVALVTIGAGAAAAQQPVVIYLPSPPVEVVYVSDPVAVQDEFVLSRVRYIYEPAMVEYIYDPAAVVVDGYGN